MRKWWAEQDKGDVILMSLLAIALVLFVVVASVVQQNTINQMRRDGASEKEIRAFQREQAEQLREALDD